MSIIREIKAAFRWVFNIKDKPTAKLYDTFCHKLSSVNVIYIMGVDDNFVKFRFSGNLTEHRLTHKDFHSHYRKIS